MSTDPEATTNFGPFVPNIGSACPVSGRSIRYDNIDDLEAALKIHGANVAAFLIEPIQGEAGIVIPSDGYLRKAYDLCKKYNVLFIADEIQTGLGRTGAYRNRAYKFYSFFFCLMRFHASILNVYTSGGLLP